MDDDLLSVEQLLLLENLTYLVEDNPLKSLVEMEVVFEAEVEADSDAVFTVEYLISNIKTEQLIAIDGGIDNATKDYGSIMTGQDWYNTIEAIKKDETLCNIVIRNFTRIQFSFF